MLYNFSIFGRELRHQISISKLRHDISSHIYFIDKICPFPVCTHQNMTLNFIPIFQKGGSIYKLGQSSFHIVLAFLLGTVKA